MNAPCDIPELPEDDAVLREIAAMDLALARRLYSQAMAEPEAEKAADITRAYNRVTRSLRQSLALRAKLAQDRENHHMRHSPVDAPNPFRAPGPAAAGFDPAFAAGMNPRREMLRRALQRMVWNERETERLDGPAAARLRDSIRHDATEAAEDPALAAAPVERLIADVCRRYGIRYNPHWQTLPQPDERWLYPILQRVDDG